jgi:hypothetical protein
VQWKDLILYETSRNNKKPTKAAVQNNSNYLVRKEDTMLRRREFYDETLTLNL